MEVEPAGVGAPPLEPSERLKAPILSADDERSFPSERAGAADEPVHKHFATEPQDHRTVERTKAPPVLDPR